MFNTLKDIRDLTKQRIDETDEDIQIDTIVDSAINNAYLFDLSKIDVKLSTTILVPVNGLIELPDDIHDIINLSPVLSQSSKRVGNYVITDQTDTFTLIYSTVPEFLSKDTDVINLNMKYRYMLSTYACYAYFSYRKKVQVAEMFLNEYNNQKQSASITNDDLYERVHDVIYNTTEGDN